MLLFPLVVASSLKLQNYYIQSQGLTFQVTIDTTQDVHVDSTIDYAVGLTTTPTPGCPLLWSTGKLSDLSAVTLFKDKRIRVPGTIQVTAGSYTAHLYAILNTTNAGTFSCFGNPYFPLQSTPLTIHQPNVPIAGGGGYSLYFNRSSVYEQELLDQTYFASASNQFPWVDNRGHANHQNEDVCDTSPLTSQITHSFTIEFWLKHDILGSGIGCCGDLVNIYDLKSYAQSKKSEIFLFLSPVNQHENVLIWETTAIGGPCAKPTTSIRLKNGRWHHISAVFDGLSKEKRIYIDGVLELTVGGCVLNDGVSQIITGKMLRLGNNLNGMMDEYRMFNYARTQTQIRQGMFRELRMDEIDSSVIVYYNFNELFYADKKQVLFPRPTLYSREDRSKQLVVPDLSIYGLHMYLGEDKSMIGSLLTKMNYHRVAPDYRPSTAPLVGGPLVLGPFKTLPPLTDPTRVHFKPNGPLADFPSVQNTTFFLQGLQTSVIATANFSNKSLLHSALANAIDQVQIQSVSVPIALDGSPLSPSTFNILPRSDVGDFTDLVQLTAVVNQETEGIWNLTYVVRDTFGISSPPANVHFPVYENRAPSLGDGGSMLYCDGNQDFAYAPAFRHIKQASQTQTGPISVEFWALSYTVKKYNRNTVFAFNTEGEAVCGDNTKENCNGRFLMHMDTDDKGMTEFYIGSHLRFNPNTNDSHIIMNASPSYGTWTHWAVVTDGGFPPYKTKIYVNGDLKETHPSNGHIHDIAGLYLCHWPYYSENYHYYMGYLDEFRMWKTPRTQDEIKASMYQRVNPNHPDLLVYYDFDEFKITTNSSFTVVESEQYDVYVPDRSQNKYDLILRGCTPAKKPFCYGEGDQCRVDLVPTIPCAINQNGSLAIQEVGGGWITGFRLDPNPKKRISLVKSRPQIRPSSAPIGGSLPILETTMNIPVSVKLTGRDPELDRLFYYIITEPSRGKLSLAGSELVRGSTFLDANVLFTPEANEGGNPYTQFAYGVSDGYSHSAANNLISVNVKCRAGFYLQNKSCFPCSPGTFLAEPSYNSSCFTCPRHTYQSGVNASACLKCPYGSFQDQVGQSQCKSCEEYGYPAPCPSQVYLRSFQQATLQSFTSILILALIACITMIYMWRQSRVILSGTPLLMNFTLAGGLLILLGVIIMYSSPSIESSYVQKTLYTIGCTFGIVPLVLKNYRLYRIFNNKRATLLRRISTGWLVVQFGVFVLIDLILLTIWFVASPFEPITLTNASCSSEQSMLFGSIIVGWKAAILFVALWISYISRTLPSLYNESKSMQFALYNVTLIGIIHILLNYTFFNFLSYANFLIIDGLLWVTNVVVTAVVLF